MNFGYKKLYVGGKLIDSVSGERRTIYCPATEEAVADIAWAGKEDARIALAEAQKGFETWSKMSLSVRTDWMMKLREEVIKNEDILRKAMVYEMGKTYESAAEDIEAVVNGLEFYPGAMRNMHDEIIPDYENTHRHKLVNMPAGVAVAYLAWNFPLLNVGFKIGPALAAGCSIIIKPSALSPVSAYILGEIMYNMNFPAGVVNIISGSSSEVGTELTTSKITKVITMIGSSATGRRVIADSATSIKHVSMELGGNAPYIVLEDADVDAAVNLAVILKYNNCGQICVSPNRFFIHEAVYDEFLSKFTEKAKNLKIGFGVEEKPDMGPLVTRGDRERLLKLVEDDVNAGATLVLGGKIPKGMDKGNFIEPTILTGITPSMRSFREELFGPVAPFIKISNIDEAIQLANDTEYGLSSYVFSRNENYIRRSTEELEFGEVHVNGAKYAIYLPHGGIKESGVGHDCSYLALNDYLVKKRITTTL
jgi:succinate-semialdehyde dehydrogenase/glutarate-semialdehyde dehydrogenase